MECLSCGKDFEWVEGEDFSNLCQECLDSGLTDCGTECCW